MNIFARLKTFNDFTETEKRIVNYIENNALEFSLASIDEIVEVCESSHSAIYRFCKKMGYTGFNELKHRVSVSMTDIDVYSKNKILNYNYPFIKTDNTFTVIAKIRELYDLSLREASNYITFNELEKAVKDIQSVKNVDIYAEINYYNLSAHFGHKLTTIGKNCWCSSNSEEKIIQAYASDETHIAFIISYFPVANKLKEIIKILKGNGVKVILITDHKKHELLNFGTYNFYLVSHEQRTEKISTFSTDISLMYLFDCLYAMLFKIDYEKNNNFRMKTNLKIDNV
jgi:Transcriptional regulators